MPLILALDTSSHLGGVAICRDGATVAHRALGEGLRHGRLLLPAIEELLRGAGLSLSDMNYIACGVGPGSYTGTRVGVMTAKALAFGAQKPCLPVSSLQALAAGLCEEGEIIIPAQDARRDEIYTAVYRFDADHCPVAVRADVALSPEETARQAEGLDGRCVIAGSALAKYPEVFGPLRERGIRLLEEAPANLAERVGLLACTARRELVSALELEPVYLRRDDAPCTFERFMS